MKPIFTSSYKRSFDYNLNKVKQDSISIEIEDAVSYTLSDFRESPYSVYTRYGEGLLRGDYILIIKYPSPEATKLVTFKIYEKSEFDLMYIVYTTQFSEENYGHICDALPIINGIFSTLEDAIVVQDSFTSTKFAAQIGTDIIRRKIIGLEKNIEINREIYY